MSCHRALALLRHTVNNLGGGTVPENCDSDITMYLKFAKHSRYLSDSGVVSIRNRADASVLEGQITDVGRSLQLAATGAKISAALVIGRR